MKSFLNVILLIVSIILLPTSLLAQDGWFWQNPTTINLLHSVDFVNASTGWAVGRYGTIIRTTDGGPGPYKQVE